MSVDFREQAAIAFAVEAVKVDAGALTSSEACEVAMTAAVILADALASEACLKWGHDTGPICGEGDTHRRCLRCGEKYERVPR